MDFMVPFSGLAETVRPEWAGSDGLMRWPYAQVLVQQGVTRFLEQVGIDDTYRRDRRCGTFAVQGRFTNGARVRPGDGLRVWTQLLGHDEKRLHSFYWVEDDDRRRIATYEVVALHVDLEKRRSVPFPDDLRPRIEALQAAHAALTTPDGLGLPVDLSRPADDRVPA